MADEVPLEEYPTEIEEYLTEFHSSLDSVSNMVKTMVSVSRNELQQKLDPLEQAKLDLMSAYALNSLFWTYLVTQGMSPKEHGVKQELERIRTYMNKVREITDRKKAARLDKGAASRFLRSALWEAGKEKAGAAGKEKAGAAGKEKAGAAGKEKAGAAGKEKAGAAGKEKAGTAPHGSQSAKRQKQS